MWFVIIAVFSLFGIAVFLSIPFSPTRANFNNIVKDKTIKEAGHVPEVFAETDIKNLPAPVQRYFRYCGYMGKPKMNFMTASLTGVDFVMSETKTIKIRYQQLNLIEKPERYALITSSLAGVPFEGLDSYKNGKGSMKGVLAKIIPIFYQQGENMDRSSLVTWLAECLLVPNAALQSFVTWEQIDDTNAKAAIAWVGIHAGGVFTFSNEGELLSFRTADRVAVDMNGKETKADWSAYYRDYHLANGILQPNVLQSVWHFEGGDCIYFNRNEAAVSICYQ